MKTGYRLFGTTADVGAVSFGDRLEEAFEAQARGMFAVMTDLRRVRPAMKFDIRAEAGGADEAGLLAAWLEELLFVSDVKGVFLRRFEVDSITGGSVTGRAYGEEIDRSRHVMKAQVKAVTHHEISVRKTEDGYETRVIYDI